MKRLLVFNITIIAVFWVSSPLFSQGSGKRMYLKVPEENFRSAPNGNKIGTLLEGTEMTVVSESNNWAKVQVTGWIWKPSLTEIKAVGGIGDYRALHILVKSREEAEKAINAIKAGEDFMEIAKRMSILTSAAKGGDLGYFNKGDFDAKFEAAILSLKVGEVSGIVQTDFGFNIFKRLK